MMKGNNGAFLGCEWVKAHLDAYLDGELNTKQASDVKAHLDICPDCAAQYEEAKELLALVAAADDVLPDPQAHEAVMRVVAAEPRRSRRISPLTWRRLGATLAGVCLLLALLIVPPTLRNGLSPAPESPDTDTAPEGPGIGGEPCPPAEEPGDAPSYDSPPDADKPEDTPSSPEEPEVSEPVSPDAPGSSGSSDDEEYTKNVYVLYRQTPAPEGATSLWEALGGEWLGETASLSVSSGDHIVQFSNEDGDIWAEARLVENRLILNPDTDKMINFWVRLDGDTLWLTKIP